MSGHSKWATIHRQKEVKDAKRGAAFTKLARAITIAVRQGGGVTDPNQNFKLRLAVEKARQFNMPKENISRAIGRATGQEGEQLEETTLEGFLPGGAAVLVQILSDNRLRTSQAVREILDKGGGSLAGSGAAGFLFSQQGEIVVKFQAIDVKSTDEQELELIDVGAVSIDREADRFVIHCDPKQTFAVKEIACGLGYEVEAAELVMHPTTLVGVDPTTQTKIEALLRKLEDLDDVSKVWTNYA